MGRRLVLQSPPMAIKSERAVHRNGKREHASAARVIEALTGPEEPSPRPGIIGMGAISATGWPGRKPPVPPPTYLDGVTGVPGAGYEPADRELQYARGIDGQRARARIASRRVQRYDEIAHELRATVGAIDRVLRELRELPEAAGFEDGSPFIELQRARAIVTATRGKLGDAIETAQAESRKAADKVSATLARAARGRKTARR